MPSVEDIRDRWDDDRGWAADGEEWSGPWGGAEPQWRGTLLPRIHAFVPAGTILEIGPGRGRWTGFLKGVCDELVLVDVSQRSLQACARRFAGDAHLQYHQGDGRSLPFVADGSVDFAFSFDSLVHAEADVMDAYAAELARVLAPEHGVAFLHHSNMGEHRGAAALARRFPARVRRPLIARGALVNTEAWRAESATAAGFAESCRRAGLSCVAQELIAWEYGRHLTDVISTVTVAGSRWDRAPVVRRNPGFMDEARRARLHDR